MTDYKIIFWDFDGVIKESASIKTHAFTQLFLHYGQATADKVKAHQLTHGGMSRYEKFPIYLNWAGELATPEKVNSLCSKFSEMVVQSVVNSDWIPGVLEYLRMNYHRQIFIIVTATPILEIKTILCALGIGNLFKGVYGSPVSKAEAIADGLANFKCNPDDALMIGDSYIDLCAAKKNEVSFLLRRTLENQHLINQFSINAIDNFLGMERGQ